MTAPDAPRSQRRLKVVLDLLIGFGILLLAFAISH
jgi:hypothetical protein